MDDHDGTAGVDEWQDDLDRVGRDRAADLDDDRPHER
jgi:hypothetical protein